MKVFDAVVNGFQKGVRSALHPRIIQRAAPDFRARAAGANSLEQALELTYRFNFCGIRVKPGQVRSEIRAFLTAVASRRPKVLLEIGTANGGSLFLFSRIAADDALLISVDLPHGMYGGGYPAWRIPLYQAFARNQQRVELLQADSHNSHTISRVETLLAGRTLDLLFIDGDHTYEGVKMDFEKYSPLMSPGGVVGFHDIVPGPEASVGGVPRFWGEFKEKFPVTEIVADWTQGGYGIGYTTT